MRRFIAIVLFLTILVSACTPKPAVAGKDFENFSANNFDYPTNITNKWFPLKSGMQYVYEGITNDDEGNQVSRRLVVTVTDLTKVIDGVNTVVSWDRDYNDDSLVEAELAFYAQDNNGTVWRRSEERRVGKECRL